MTKKNKALEDISTNKYLEDCISLLEEKRYKEFYAIGQKFNLNKPEMDHMVDYYIHKDLDPNEVNLVKIAEDTGFSIDELIAIQKNAVTI